MADVFKGVLAQGFAQGTDPAATLLAIEEKMAYKDKVRTDEIESYTLTVSSHSIRYKPLDVVVPAQGYKLPITDDDLSVIAENGGDYPLVLFKGLEVRQSTRAESWDVTCKGSATEVSLYKSTSTPVPAPAPKIAQKSVK